jgi:hypothetical protein
MNYINATRAVAEDWRALAWAIYREDAYASHVSAAEKIDIRDKALIFADRVEAGNNMSFTIAQRINEKMTGESVAFISKEAAVWTR